MFHMMFSDTLIMAYMVKLRKISSGEQFARNAIHKTYRFLQEESVIRLLEIMFRMVVASKNFLIF